MTQLSVVVTAARPALPTLARCLESLAGQSLAPAQYEVLVVGADTEALAPVAAAHPDHRLTAVPVPGSADATTGVLRNAGVAAASGTYTVFVRAEDRVSPTYLELMLASAHPDHVAVARLVDETAHGTRETDASRLVDAKSGRRVLPQDARALSEADGAKLFPTQWLRETPYPEDLRTGGAAAFSGHLFSPYRRQFAQYDLGPAHAGATYFRAASDTPDDRDLATVLADGLAVISSLTEGTQHDPVDRAAVTTDLVDSQLRALRAALRAHPEGGDDLARVVKEAGVPGITAHHLVTGTSGGFGLFHNSEVDTRGIVVAAGRASTVNEHANLVIYLAKCGIDVRVLHYRGGLTPRLRRNVRPHRISVLRPATADAPANASRGSRLARRVYREGVRAGRRVLPEVVPARAARRLFTRVDDYSAQVLQETAKAYAFDREGGLILTSFHTNPTGAGDSGLHALAATAMRIAAGGVGTSRDESLGVKAASAALRDVADPEAYELFPGLWSMAAFHLLRVQRLDAAAAVLADAERIFPDERARLAAGIPALQGLVGLHQGTGAEGVRDLVARTLADADAALAEMDTDRLVFLTTVALELLFFRSLHTATGASPLVSDPDAFLAPLRESRVGELLRSPASPRLERRASPSGSRPSVVVLPGAYPKFAAAVVSELAPVADVSVLDLSQRDGRFRTTGVEVDTVREMLLSGLGQQVRTDHQLRDLQRCDVLFVDWADKGLAWATRVVPEGVRVVVRMHGVDTLSVWAHTVVWERVDEIVFPSEHLRRAANAVLGDRIAAIRQHVVHNPVDVPRYRLPKTPGAEKTLGMVGWAQQVKDPLWTLDVLEALRREDPEWRLLLIGADFPAAATNTIEGRAAKEFRRRLLTPEVAPAVDFVGYTSNLTEHLRRVGWGVSSSLRESFHIGLVEMAASGAVPVVREWPLYASLGGASSLFPQEWVSASPQEAAARILEVSRAGEWEQHSRAAVDHVVEHFSGEFAGERFREIVLDGLV